MTEQYVKGQISKFQILIEPHDGIRAEMAHLHVILQKAKFNVVQLNHMQP